MTRSVNFDHGRWIPPLSAMRGGGWDCPAVAVGLSVERVRRLHTGGDPLSRVAASPDQTVSGWMAVLPCLQPDDCPGRAARVSARGLFFRPSVRRAAPEIGAARPVTSLLQLPRGAGLGGFLAGAGT